MEMTKRLTIEEAAEWLAGRDNILILCHTRPDGDTLGSAFALRAALRLLSKRAFCLCDTRIPKRLSFLAGEIGEQSAEDGEDISLSSLPADFRWETVVSVDVAAPQLLGDYEELFGRGHTVDLAVDHHQTHTYFSKLAAVEGDCSACGELIYDLVRFLLKTSPLPRPVAEPLYAAISSDSGSFRFSSVTARTHCIAAALLESGIDHAAIAERLYGCKTLAEITASRAAYNEMKLLSGGKTALLTFSTALMEKYGLTDADIEGVVNQLRDIEGVRVAVHLKARGERTYKVSARSVPDIDISKVCALLGGGGHPCAAGCTVNADTPEEAEAVFLAAMAQVYPKLV